MATLFGLATSLGFGATQTSSGLKFLFGIDNGIKTQIAVIAGSAVGFIFALEGVLIAEVCRAGVFVVAR